jgi:hypothetical protein
MVTQALFESGLRLDQYIATISLNKENFRANFIKAIEAYSPEDILYFRTLPDKINVAVITEDDNPDALRDVPLIGRISVEGGRVGLRLFRLSQHTEAVAAIIAEIGIEKAERQHLPVIAWLNSDMQLLGAHIRRLPDLHDEMQQRHRDWIVAHPEVKDAGEPIEAMSPVTRTRILQAMFALTAEQRLHWGRRTVAAWRGILDGLGAHARGHAEDAGAQPDVPAAGGDGAIKRIDTHDDVNGAARARKLK